MNFLRWLAELPTITKLGLALLLFLVGLKVGVVILFIPFLFLPLCRKG
jgi:hypothetical protein